MDRKRNGLACVLTGVGTGVLMLLLLYAVCPLFDTDMYMLFFKGAGKEEAGRTAGLCILFLPPLIPPTVSIISLIRKDGKVDAMLNSLLAGIVSFIIQVLYVLILLQS